MKFLNEVPFLKIGIVLFVMPASQAFAIEPNQVYLAQASAWQCRLTWAGGGTTLGQGGTKDAALQDLNRQVSLDRVNNNGQNYSVGTTCFQLASPTRNPPSPAPNSSSSDAQQKIIGFYRDFLSRQPRPDEIDFRMDAFRKGYPVERQRTDIAFSDEVRQKIIGFYRQYLRRSPESGAIEFRMNALLNGRTLEQQRVDIQASPEARSKQ